MVMTMMVTTKKDITKRDMTGKDLTGMGMIPTGSTGSALRDSHLVEWSSNKMMVLV